MNATAPASPDQTSSATMPVASSMAPGPRFVGTVHWSMLPQPLRLKRFRTIIGRRNADLLVEDPDVSRQHAALERYEERYLIRDLGSTNGTFVNGRKVDVEILHPGDVIQVGDTRITFRIELE